MRLLLLILGTGIVLTSLLACDSRTRTSLDAGASLDSDDCRSYFDIYAACMRRLSPKSPEIAAARVESARQALAHIDDAERLRLACRDGARQLRTSCN